MYLVPVSHPGGPFDGPLLTGHSWWSTPVSPLGDPLSHRYYLSCQGTSCPNRDVLGVHCVVEHPSSALTASSQTFRWGVILIVIKLSM